MVVVPSSNKGGSLQLPVNSAGQVHFLQVKETMVIIGCVWIAGGRGRDIQCVARGHMSLQHFGVLPNIQNMMISG